MRLLVSLTLSAVLLSVAPTVAHAGDPVESYAKEVVLGLRQQTPVVIEGAERVEVVNPAIATAEIGEPGGQIMILALKEGTTQVKVWRKDAKNPVVVPVRVKQ
jgi:Flp pilus assembly secretin CpaC